MSIEHAIVTGASGFIGSSLVRRLVRMGIEVVGLSRETVDIPGCKSFSWDVQSPGMLDEYLTPHSTVFHLAAHANVSGSVRDPSYDFQVNVMGTFHVLESVRACNAKMVFVSSSAVYDPRQPLPHAENAYRLPSSPYGAAKIAGEAYCQAYARCFGLDVKIARLFNVYGPGMTRFAIKDFYSKLSKDPNRLEILGDGSQIRDYLYIDDCLDGLLLIATRGAIGEDYNLASGEPITSIDLARLVAKQMSLGHVEISAKGMSFPGDVSKWFADVSKIRALEFAPKIDIATGIRNTIDWFRWQEQQMRSADTPISSREQG